MNTLQQLRDVYSTTFAWESARHANERRHLYGLVYKVCGYINNRCSVLSDEKALLFVSRGIGLYLWIYRYNRRGWNIISSFAVIRLQGNSTVVIV